MNLNAWLHIQELREKEISQILSCDRNEDDIQVVWHLRAKISVN